VQNEENGERNKNQERREEREREREREGECVCVFTMGVECSGGGAKTTVHLLIN
jgi:hypothetical protein